MVYYIIPSHYLLFKSRELKEVISPTLTIKVVGHQWFWSYELSDFVTDNGTAIDFDSYMTPADWFSKSKLWVQISNSGNALKIQVLNPDENIRGGQINYLGKVK